MDMVSMLTERRAVQRRNALRALGIGVTAVAAGTVATEAKGKKRRQKAKDRCPKQVATCEAAFASFCNEKRTEERFKEECLASARECCAPLKACDAGSAMDCLVFRFLVS